MEERSILSILTPEQARIIDKHGYDFLVARGYAAAGAQDSRQIRSLLRKELKDHGEVFIMKEEKQGKYILFYHRLSSPPSGRNRRKQIPGQVL